MENSRLKIYDKIINVILLLMIFGITLGFNLVTYDSAFIKISVLQIGATLAFGFWLIKLLEEKRLNVTTATSQNSRFRFFFNLPLLTFFIWGIFTFLKSPYRGVGLEELIKLFCYVGIYFVVVNNVREKRFKRIIYSLLIAAFISVLYGFVQYFGLDPFIWKGAFSKRIFSTFGNPNFFGAYLVLTAPLVLTIFLRNKKYIFLVLFTLLTLCIFLTGSKGAWLAFAGEMVVFSILAIVFLSHTKKKKVKAFLITLPILIVLVSATGVLILARKRPDSILFRLLTWRSTLQMVELNPVTGNGLNSFRVIYPLYRDREIFRIEGKHQTETQHPENEYIEIASDEGIIGLGIFFWMLMTFYTYGLKKLQRLKEELEIIETDEKNKSKKEPYSPIEYKLSFLVGLITGLSGLLIHNLFGVNMRFVSSGFFFWLCLGLINLQVLGYPSEVEAQTREQKSPRFIFRLLELCTVCVAIFLIVIFIRFYRADIHHNRGISYSKARIWDKALAEYQKVIDFNPYFTMAHYFKGNVYNDRWEEGDAERTLAKYQDVKKLAPNYVMVHYQEGIVYNKLGQWNEAIKNFKKAIALDPVFALTYFRMGWAYTQLKDFNGALGAFKKAVEIQPNFFDAYINLGNIQFMLKDYDGSEASFRKAHEINPENITVYRNLGLLYANLKRFPEAAVQWRKALEIAPENQEIKHLLDSLRKRN